MGLENDALNNHREVKINPENTQRFIRDILEKSEEGIYRVQIKIGDKLIPIDVYPNVFPPKSDYSASSKSVYEAFGGVKGRVVADIGCGTGIESIVAALHGAERVDATDISTSAAECAKHNAELNNLDGVISVYHGDLFSPLPKRKYNLIIANLPIVDSQPETSLEINRALYDPNLEIHKRLFSEAKEFLADDGIITFTHANLQSAKTENPDRDFEILENLIRQYDYEITEKTEREEIGYKWINYKIKPRKQLPATGTQ